MKSCQFCAEEIQDNAIFCRHCRRDQIGATSSSAIPALAPAPVVYAPPAAAVLPPSNVVEVVATPVATASTVTPPTSTPRLPETPVVIGRKSWVAYAKGVAPWGFVGCCAALGALVSSPEFVLVFFPFLAIAVYRYFDLREVKIEISKNGVYLSQGILPWSKGRDGLSWRDCGGAYFSTGLESWLTGSGAIRVEHRFTRTEGFTVTDIADAKRVAAEIAAQIDERPNTTG
jgi:hypothetical protein